MSTAAALLMALVAWIVVLASPVAPGAVHPLGFMPGLLVFVAAPTGILCLVFTPLAHRARLTPPPKAITLAAVLIGAAPLITIAILTLRG